MKLRIIVRVGLAALLLVGVFWLKQNATPQSMERFFAALGIELDAGGGLNLQPSNRALQPGEYREILCPSRLVRIAYTLHSSNGADGSGWLGRQTFEIEDRRDGLRSKWYALDDASGSNGPREVNYMAVEKWLSGHCQFIASPLDGESAPSPATSPSPAASPVVGATPTAGEGRIDRVLFQTVSGAQWALLRSGPDEFAVDWSSSKDWPNPVGLKLAASESDRMDPSRRVPYRFRSADLAQALDELAEICAN